jgi:hypothetical protein
MAVVAEEQTHTPLERSMTIDELCALDGIKTSYYYMLRRKGLGPVEMRFPGSTIVRITAAARRDWHEQIRKWQETEEAQLEFARRSANARKGGLRAWESPRHYVRKKLAKLATAT